VSFAVQKFPLNSCFWSFVVYFPFSKLRALHFAERERENASERESEWGRFYQFEVRFIEIRKSRRRVLSHLHNLSLLRLCAIEWKSGLHSIPIPG